MTILGNYVVLEPEKEKVLKFAPRSFRIVGATVPDGETRKPTMKRRYEADVIEEDGQPVAKTFSTLSGRLGALLQAARETGELYRFKIGIAMRPVGRRGERAARAF